MPLAVSVGLAMVVVVILQKDLGTESLGNRAVDAGSE